MRSAKDKSEGKAPKDIKNYEIKLTALSGKTRTFLKSELFLLILAISKILI